MLNRLLKIFYQFTTRPSKGSSTGRCCGSASCGNEMSAFANEDSSVIEHLSRKEESEVPEEMLDLAVAARMRSVDNLDDVLALDRVLLGVEAERFRVLFLFLQRRGFAAHHLALHIQDL